MKRLVQRLYIARNGLQVETHDIANVFQTIIVARSFEGTSIVIAPSNLQYLPAISEWIDELHDGGMA